MRFGCGSVLIAALIAVGCGGESEAAHVDALPAHAAEYVDPCGNVITVNWATAERLYRAAIPAVGLPEADVLWESLSDEQRKRWLEVVENFLAADVCTPGAG